MARMRAIAALLALALGLIGGPLALTRVGVDPSVLLAWSVMDDGRLLLGILTLLGWLAWACFALSVAAELVNMVMGRRFVRIPLLGGLQALVAVLVLAALSSLGSAPAGHAGGPAGSNPAGTGTAAPAVPAPAVAVADASVAADTYVVRPGDDLWSIAESLLGNGADWRRLGEANPELLQDPTRHLAAGLRLSLPTTGDPRPAVPTRGDGGPRPAGDGTADRLRAEPRRAPADPLRANAGARPTRITVLRGDTLSALAQEHLGEAAAWPRIAAANRDRIADPDLIQIGWRLVLPARPGPAPKPAADRPQRRADSRAPFAPRAVPDVGTGTPATSPTQAPASPATAGTQTTAVPTATTGTPTTAATATAGPPTTTAGTPTTDPAATAPKSDVTVRPGTAASPIASPASTAPTSDVTARPGTAATPATGPASTAPTSDVTVRPGTAATPLATGVNGAPDPAAATLQGDEVPLPPALATAVQDATGLMAPVIGGLGGLAAAMILTGVAVRRQVQRRGRGLGRRIRPAATELRRYETALGRVGEPDRLRRLERVLRWLGRSFHEAGRVPQLRLLTVDEQGFAFDWAATAGPPPAGFGGDLTRWTLAATDADALPEVAGPVPFPALVTVGRTDADAWALIDLEQRGALTLLAAPAQADAVLAALVVELSCSPWAAELDVAVVGGDAAFVRAACPEVPSLTAASALTALDRVAAERALAFPDATEFARARVDPDASEVTRPRVVLSAGPAPVPTASGRVTGRGVAVVFTGGEPAGSAWRLDDDPEQPRGELLPDGLVSRAQTIPAHTRRAIAGLATAAQNPATDPAPWWAHQAPARSLGPSSPGAIVRPLPRRLQAVDEPGTAERHPELRLLGPVELVGARGSEPSRARRQCEEYCGWLLENPGRTATQMASELLVAEGTRRSNMSRLRGWLGADPDGNAYLPEAYSGRIRLSPLVTSDWQRLRVLLAPGANVAEPEQLVAALQLVRGAPLADAAPGQWCWAEELRTDISSAVRDAGVVLAARARASGDLDLARWAASRALAAAPEDELLLCERVRTERQAGNRAEVERLVLRLTQHARVLGVDLAPETVRLCQEAMEGRQRARA